MNSTRPPNSRTRATVCFSGISIDGIVEIITTKDLDYEGIGLWWYCIKKSQNDEINASKSGLDDT
jgi:hypothetical protein